MATLPSSSSPLSPSASNSDHKSTNPQPQALDNGILSVDEKPKPASIFELHSADHVEKFKKYEAGYTSWLTARYFSQKTLYGGDIFDGNVTIENEVIKSSRWPCTRSYADPVQGFEDQRSSCSVTPEASPNLSNGKHPVP